jgi:hypothetical protein
MIARDACGRRFLAHIGRLLQVLTAKADARRGVATQQAGEGS